MRQRRDVRVRWIAAGLVSVAVHGLVFLGLSLTPKAGPPPEPPFVEITLLRLKPPPPERTPEPLVRQAASPIRLHQPATVAPDAVGSGLQPGPPIAAPPAVGLPGPAPPALPQPKLKLDCLNLGPTARKGATASEDCEARRYAKTGDSDGAYEIAANPAWDAEIAGRMSKHQGLKPEKPFRNACENSNLGLGCTDDMLIPLAKKKF